jgi:hypothetical protein
MYVSDVPTQSTRVVCPSVTRHEIDKADQENSTERLGYAEWWCFKFFGLEV